MTTNYHEHKANCVQAFVEAILSTGWPVTETLIEAAWYTKGHHDKRSRGASFFCAWW